jgi:hypothetical protein
MSAAMESLEEHSLAFSTDSQKASSGSDDKADTDEEKETKQPAAMALRSAPSQIEIENNVPGVEEKNAKQTARNNANKRKQKEKTRVAKMETCAIATSDKSDSEFDFQHFTTTQKPADDWTLPIKDFWEPQANNNKKFRSSSSKPEKNHHLTQNEIYAKYPLTPGKALPIGRKKILVRAQLYKASTEEHRAKGIKGYTMGFTEQQYLDFACIADLHRPLVVDHQSYNPDKEYLAVCNNDIRSIK